MANNPHVNKVEYGGQTLIDLTSDTVTPGAMLSGVTAHDASGASIEGTLTPVTGVKGNAESEYRSGNVNLTPANIGALSPTNATTEGTSFIRVDNDVDMTKADNGVNSTTSRIALEQKDKLNHSSLGITTFFYPNGDTQVLIAAMNYVNYNSDGAMHRIRVSKSGNVTYTFSHPTEILQALGALAASQKGAASGVAELDSSGKVPSSQLPSYVDDVVEYASFSDFPVTGEAGKIYVATDTNKTYRWSGSAYVEISPSLALGETSATAYRGDRGKAAYDHAQAHGNAYASGLYKITTNAEGHVTGAAAVAKSDITALGIPAQDTTYSAATTTTDGLMSATDKAKLDGMGGSTALSLTLASGSWSSATPATQTLTATGVTANSNIVVGIAPGITPTQYDAAAAAKLVCTAQGANSITVTAYGTTPSENIPINVVIVG